MYLYSRNSMLVPIILTPFTKAYVLMTMIKSFLWSCYERLTNSYDKHSTG